MAYQEEIWKSKDGKTRVVVELDECAPMPDGDFYVPQTTISEYRNRSVQLTMSAGLPEGLENAYHSFDLDNDVFDRWALVFHGVNARVIVSDRTVIAWPDKDWRELVGVDDNYTPGDGDVSELVSWCEGNVWYATLQEAETWTNTKGESYSDWANIESVGGFYGDLYGGNNVIGQVLWNFGLERDN